MRNKITIVGSGLAGPLLAILLAKKGYTVDLFEKRSDPRQKSISAGRSINLALSHRGIKALKSADVFEQIAPHLIPMKGRMIHGDNGELDYQPYSINPNEYINSVSRAELNKILMTAAEKTNKVSIHFSQTLFEVTNAAGFELEKSQARELFAEMKKFTKEDAANMPPLVMIIMAYLNMLFPE